MLCGHTEGWGKTDSVYWSFISVFSVGYGDFCPQTQDGRLFAFFFIPLGVGVILQTVSAMSALLFNYQFENVENIAAIIRADLDNGGVTEPEFKLMMLVKLRCKPEPYIMALLRDQFNNIDIDNDGTLTVDDFDPVNIARAQAEQKRVSKIRSEHKRKAKAEKRGETLLVV